MPATSPAPKPAGPEGLRRGVPARTRGLEEEPVAGPMGTAEGGGEKKREAAGTANSVRTLLRYHASDNVFCLGLEPQHSNR